MADGKVRIKTEVDDKSLKDLRSSLKELENAFKSLQSIKPFDNVSKNARDLITDFTGISKSASQVDKDIDEIDGKSIDNVSKKAGDASSELEDTASSADKADASIDEIDGKPLDDVKKGADDAGKGMDNTTGKTKKFRISLMDIAKSAVVISAVSKLFDVLSSSLDSAISRFDTLNTFPRTMELIGYETSVVERSTRSLVRGIEGLPTKLDDVITTAQRLGGMTGDLDDATETTLALNNAFLASGASSADAARGTEQYIQMLGNGQPDMQSWRSLQETMNYALLEAAKSFGYTENGVQQLYSALKNGDITFNQFNKRLQELNKTQGGFADLALESSKTIGAAWTNIQTAISRNLANIIEVIDEMSLKITGRDIYDNLTNLKYVIDDVFGFATSVIRGVTPVIQGLWKAFEFLLTVLEPVSPLIYGITAALITMRVVSEVSNWFSGLNVAVMAVTKAMQYYVATQGATVVSVQNMGIVTKALGVVMGVATGQIKLTAVALTGFKAVLTAITGPVGWVVAGIGALVGAGVALYNIFVKASDESNELGEALKDTASETAELNDLVDQTASTYGKTKEATSAQYEAVRTLAEATAELAQKEKLSIAEKKLLKDNVEELNDSVEGLNLVYDEEQQRLTSSNDAMWERIRAAEEDSKYNDARERSKQISEQHAEATALLASNERELAEAQEHLDGLKWYQSSGEAKEGVEALQEENQRLTDQIAVLAEEQDKTNEEMEASAEQLAIAEANANAQRISSLEQLSESQRAVVEGMQERYQDLETTTTNMFSRIEEKSAISIEEMNANLLANQKAVENWSKNLALLSEQGVDQGLLDQLARLGPEGAPYVQELVDATPAQLAELEENFKKGGDVAKQGLFNSMGIKEEDMIEGLPELATRTKVDLGEAFKNANLNKVITDELSKSGPEMEKAGKEVVKGAKKGIEQGTPEVAIASMKMSKAIDEEFRKNLGIQSPSTVFDSHGQDITKGATQGIRKGTPEVARVVQELTNQIKKELENGIKNLDDSVFKGFEQVYKQIQKPLKEVPSFIKQTMNTAVKNMQDASKQSQTAGYQFGRGFYNGLNSTAGSIYSLATTIANNATKRINQALQVRSPSRKGFRSGSFLGQGLWGGMKHEEGTVEKWSDRLAQAATSAFDNLNVSPLGMNTKFNPAFASGYSNLTNQSNIQNDNGVSIHIEKIENYSDSDIPEILEQSAWIMEREGKDIDG